LIMTTPRRILPKFNEHGAPVPVLETLEVPGLTPESGSALIAPPLGCSSGLVARCTLTQLADMVRAQPETDHSTLASVEEAGYSIVISVRKLRQPPLIPQRPLNQASRPVYNRPRYAGKRPHS